MLSRILKSPKGRKLLTAGVLYLVASVVVCVVLGYFAGVAPAVVALLVLLAIAAVAALDLGVVPAAIRSQVPSSFRQDLSWRNCDKLVLGSTQAWLLASNGGTQRKVYALPEFRSSLEAQRDMLRCYFGHVRAGGQIAWVIDPREALELKGKYSPLDVKAIHKLVFQVAGMEVPSKLVKHPLLADPAWSLALLRGLGEKKRLAAQEGGPNLAKPYPNVPLSSYESYVVSIVGPTVPFCKERDLVLHVYVLGATHTEAEALGAALCCECSPCESPQQLERVVRA